MKKIFVTGASGYIAKHILRELFENGYEVRASVRSPKRKAELETLFPKAKLDFVFLDLSKDDGWSEAMAGCDALIHTASPIPMNDPKDPEELIRPAVDGTLRALGAAKTAGITRVVLTSSCAAIYKQAGKDPAASSDETNWTSPESPKVMAYEASKTLAEKAAWDFVAQHPEIALTTINPGVVFGAPMDEHYGTSLEIVAQMASGKIPMAPPINAPIVDVRDVAMMHVASLKIDATKGERFAATQTAMTFLEIAETLLEWDANLNAPKKNMPMWLITLLSPFMRDLRALKTGIGMNLAVSGAKAERTFGFTFTPAKETITNTLDALRTYKAL